MTREPLMSVELSDIAPGRSAGGTNDGSKADQAGMLSAPPIPTPSCARNNAQIGASMRARAASTREKVSMTICMDDNHLRRSTESAMTPAGMASNNKGTHLGQDHQCHDRRLPGAVVNINRKHHILNPGADVGTERRNEDSPELLVRHRRTHTSRTGDRQFASFGGEGRSISHLRTATF